MRFHRRLVAPALVACALPALAAASAVLGPPAICHPIDIGSARSLPFGEHSQGAKDYDATRAVPDALAILRASDHTLVHMETLRRAVLYTERAGGDRELALVDALRARLIEAQVAAADQGAAGERSVALAWFDLGYAQAALRQLGYEHAGAADGALRQAERLLASDGGAQLGLALARWQGHKDPGADTWRHLDKAAELSDDRKADPDGLLRKNLLSTAGGMLGARTHDELVAAIDSRRVRG